MMNEVHPSGREPRDRLVLALDVDTLASALAWVERTSRWVGVFKVGLELFVSSGPPIVREIRQRGGEVFLDLKLMDIPRTVERTVAAACRLGVRMMTLHALGGRRMLEAAAWRVREECRGGEGPLLLGVTILTSLDESDLRDLGLPGGVDDHVERLARIARQSGLGGVVAAPGETRRIKEATGGVLQVVTPGIRIAGSDPADQKRTATPREAIEAGADFLVVGRPVLESHDPEAVLGALCDEIRASAG